MPLPLQSLDGKGLRSASLLISLSKRMSLGSIRRSPVAFSKLNCTGSSSSISFGFAVIPSPFRDSTGIRSLMLTRADSHVDQFTTCIMLSEKASSMADGAVEYNLICSKANLVTSRTFSQENIFISTENFSILMIYVNLKRSER